MGVANDFQPGNENQGAIRAALNRLAGTAGACLAELGAALRASIEDLPEAWRSSIQPPLTELEAALGAVKDALDNGALAAPREGNDQIERLCWRLDVAAVRVLETLDRAHAERN